MSSQQNLTGKSRRRVTKPGVRFGDALARGVITAGGIGTIAAVLMMGVFLLAVALPLFRPARVSELHRAGFDMAESGTDGVAASGTGPGQPAPIALGADETGVVGWYLDLAAKRMRLFDIAGGRVLIDRRLPEGEFQGATALRVLPGGTLAAVGYADGSFQTARIGVESSFVPEAEVPADVHPLPVGGTRVEETGILFHDEPNRYSRIAILAAAEGEPSRNLSGRVVDIDVTTLSGGPLLAAVDAGGVIRVETVSSKRNMLTDTVVTTRKGATIPAEDAVGSVPPFRAAFVRVSELGDQLWAIAADGRGQRYAIRAIESPRLMETFAAGEGQAVTAVARLFGGNSLAVADAGGTVRVFFTSRQPAAAAEDGLEVVAAKRFDPLGPAQPAAVTAIAPSPRSRLFAVADARGMVRLLQSTNQSEILGVESIGSERLASPPVGLALAGREKTLLAADANTVVSWGFDVGYPEVTPASLFGRVWYENYPLSVHAWETTGHEAFESKFGFVPLVCGTIKATLYAMLFATPVAILAAIFSSQFLHPRWRSRVKPVVEMMASLPSVVLGFMAGLILAPLVENGLTTVISAFFVVPLVLLVGAHLWLLLPVGWRMRLAAWRFPIIGLVGLPLGAGAAWALAPLLESWLFAGDLRAWLDGRGGSGIGGWVLALLPLAAVCTAVFCSRVVNPWLRTVSRGWTSRRAALVSLLVFLAGVVLTVFLALAAGTFFDSLRMDTRGGLLGSYVQRNAMIVAFGMSFAIIPLIFTIADDALSSVPDHLRSASLGAGATPWQTAIRVIVPAATSGIFSAVMIGLGRAVGETMIVLMAAGNTPIMDWNLFNGFQTLSAAIATELPEAARGSAHYRVLFLAALTLFAMTFVLNTAAEIIRERFRRRSHEL